jgi:hypothetical protein
MDLQNQEEMELLFNKNQTMRRLRAEADLPEIRKHCEVWDLPADFTIELIAQLCLHKRAKLPVMIGILRRFFLDSENPSQTCCDMIVRAAQAGLANMAQTYRGDIEVFIELDVSPEVRADLAMFQYPLPMLVEPNAVRINTDVGMFTIKGSIILKDNHHEDDVCLDHINRVNMTKFSINQDVVRLVRNSWKDLDHQREDEELEDYQARVRAFEKYDTTSRDVIDFLICADEGQGANFYLTHRYDKRGRTYAQGYHVNPQGNDWNKAIIQFADAEPLNAE